MFIDTGGWGRPGEPAPPRPRMTARQEWILLRLVLLNLLFLLLAPLGGGTVVEGVMALLASLR